MAIKVGVLLSGCGMMDGSEIHESVLTLLALDLAGAEAVCFAPDMEQKHVVNHITGKEVSGEKRNVLIEGARIARGKIKNIKDVRAGDLDAIILPGGYGAAKNLSTFAFDGAKCTVNPEVKRVLFEMLKERKPIGGICIAPAALAKAFEGHQPSVSLTIGTDTATAQKLEQMGAKQINKQVHEIHVDEVNRIVTTPAYMLGPGIKEVWKGIEKLVNQVVSMVKEPAARL